MLFAEMFTQYAKLPLKVLSNILTVNIFSISEMIHMMKCQALFSLKIKKKKK